MEHLTTPHIFRLPDACKRKVPEKYTGSNTPKWRLIKQIEKSQAKGRRVGVLYHRALSISCGGTDRIIPEDLWQKPIIY